MEGSIFGVFLDNTVQNASIQVDHPSIWKCSRYCVSRYSWIKCITDYLCSWAGFWQNDVTCVFSYTLCIHLLCSIFGVRLWLSSEGAMNPVRLLQNYFSEVTFSGSSSILPMYFCWNTPGKWNMANNSK